MDLVQSIQLQLHELRNELSDLGHDYEGMSPDLAANTMIANMMNILETLFVVLNLPADGFVSLTQGSQQNDNASEEASSGGM